ncbi:MAG: hypothetical protein B9S33_02505 [Pedosphaera sp. Tous-C6FEB]|nr:MAG: hypothetical protein B9S33_02505 [Pedosphaera sp. Tous-C6FEB]
MVSASRQLVCWSLLLAFAAASSGADFVEFRFREPQPATYRVALPAGVRLTAMLKAELPARRLADPTLSVDLTSRISLQLAAGVDVRRLVEGTRLVVDREIAPQWFVLQAPDAWTAALEAERLAGLVGVIAAHPVRRFPLRSSGPYAARFNDRLIPNQWNLENRNANGVPLGADLNVRAAWPLSQGAGVLIAIADSGVDLAHPDFQAPAADQPHYNFDSGNTNGAQLGSFDNHGTAVAGYAVARGNNGVGISGVAPAADLASWKMLGSTEEALMNMFQFMSNRVAVQNHSWLNSGSGLIGISAIEGLGLTNALTLGRGGRGIIMVRAAGNERPSGANANYQLYTADARVITVAGVRITGRVASYSTPGAPVLVAAPVGDTGLDAPPTTDRTGSTFGYNRGITYLDDSADYAFNSLIPQGTSFAAPQISGLCALLIGANTNLTIRDVQQILLLSARHFDFADPDLATNSAGLAVSHNLGYGTPDAGLAVRLAKVWVHRPAATDVTLTSTVSKVIPDLGFVVRLSGVGVLPGDATMPGWMPGESLHPDEAPGERLRLDDPTASVPLVFVGQANGPLTTNLTGKGALIERGTTSFTDKLKHAENAGAALAIIYNHETDTLLNMSLTNFTRLPSIFIGKTNGQMLAAIAQTNDSLRVQLEQDTARYTFAVTNQLSCEHVAVRLQTSHSFLGDLRITLISPAGTRSILQRFNPTGGGSPLTDWTYFSTHHFYESTVGTWTVQVGDEQPADTGSVNLVSLTLTGVSIRDTDADGLDDDWELAHLGSLAFGLRDDPDGDGFSNAREQAIGSHPAQLNSPFPFTLDASPWDAQLLRLSWPSAFGRTYELRTNASPAGIFSTLTNTAGRFPDGEVFVPYGNGAQFFQLRTP